MTKYTFKTQDTTIRAIANDNSKLFEISRIKYSINRQMVPIHTIGQTPPPQIRGVTGSLWPEVDIDFCLNKKFIIEIILETHTIKLVDAQLVNHININGYTFVAAGYFINKKTCDDDKKDHKGMIYNEYNDTWVWL